MKRMTSKYSDLYQAADGSLMRPRKISTLYRQDPELSQLRALRITKVKNDKLQASSCKQQASSNKRQAATCTNNKINISTNHE
jgi:hypothetical protein